MNLEIDPRLAQDSLLIHELPLCQVRLMDDARFPWLLLIPRRKAVELLDLTAEERHQLMDEIALTCTILRRLEPCDKLNVATLGNMVRQLHIHVVARHTQDEAWPGPVWGVGQRQAYDPAEAACRLAAIKAALQSQAGNQLKESKA